MNPGDHAVALLFTLALDTRRWRAERRLNVLRFLPRITGSKQDRSTPSAAGPGRGVSLTDRRPKQKATR